MRLIKITGIIVLFFVIGVLFMKKNDVECLQGRHGHIAYTDAGLPMFVSHTEINDGIPLMELCPKK